ncbi:DUF2169 domain-containing protein [Uliginosibacterium flavum]|uniref:DUF2169 domain-containing protein n=1 Tax=Uliginosibacterium flavum TaxID=1396831 RepID=A0ABV2THY8_9RHOO
MELINATRLQVAYTMGMEPSGRELLVIAIKGTFPLPSKAGESARLHDEQQPLFMADVFHGEPGLSAPRYEIDFAPRKQACDILLNASAYAPYGRPVGSVPVGVRIGNWQKAFNVVGARHWQAGVSSISASAPQAFTQQAIHYGTAFGGGDLRHEDPARHAAFMLNPVGCGFHQHLQREWIDGAPLPNTEEIGRAITHPQGDYAPMAFGPIGRQWAQRAPYAGTYDDAWLEEHFPFLPPDFDERYYQAAPLDQQLPFPIGGQEVTLLNLTPDGQRSFTLPGFEAPVWIFPKAGGKEEYRATLDTVVLEPDEERYTLTWRLCRPLKKSMFEIGQILVGRQGEDWWKQREEIAFYVSPDLIEILDAHERELAGGKP